jgi:hypothetical protein
MAFGQQMQGIRVNPVSSKLQLCDRALRGLLGQIVRVLRVLRG